MAFITMANVITGKEAKMTDYMVSIDHQEENEDQLSLTGTVNGNQCATIINKRALALVPKVKQQDYKDREMINAFLTRKESIGMKPGRKVTVE